MNINEALDAMAAGKDVRITRAFPVCGNCGIELIRSESDSPTNLCHTCQALETKYVRMDKENCPPYGNGTVLTLDDCVTLGLQIAKNGVGQFVPASQTITVVNTKTGEMRFASVEQDSSLQMEPDEIVAYWKKL